MVYKNDIMSRYFEHAGYLSQKKRLQFKIINIIINIYKNPNKMYLIW